VVTSCLKIKILSDETFFPNSFSSAPDAVYRIMIYSGIRRRNSRKEHLKPNKYLFVCLCVTYTIEMGFDYIFMTSDVHDYLALHEVSYVSYM
jgi:hypothetical protein